MNSFPGQKATTWTVQSAYLLFKTFSRREEDLFKRRYKVYATINVRHSSPCKYLQLANLSFKM